MPHFFVKPENIQGGRCVIAGPEAHHIVNVRRCGPGSEIQVFDGTGRVFRVRIDTVGPEEVVCSVLGEEKSSLPSIAVDLYSAVPKGDRFDWLVEKAAELGVQRIVPLVTARSVLKDIPGSKVERWRRLSQAACQQCRRSGPMEVGDPVRLEDAVASLSPADLNIIPWEAEESRTVADVAHGGELPARSNIFIGPEGGFSPKEIERALGAGVVPVTMGPRILRVETAGLLATFLVMNLSGEFGTRKED